MFWIGLIIGLVLGFIISNVLLNAICKYLARNPELIDEMADCALKRVLKRSQSAINNPFT